MSISGIILINKQQGCSSNSVATRVKKILKLDKVGHIGTLDVLGEGLLPIAIGKGTKLFDYFLNKDKTYKTTFKFGYTTTTLDLEGEITNRNDVIVTEKELREVLHQFTGKYNQMPPLYSAKKVNGKNAYEYARKGQEVVLKPKEVEIYSIKILKVVDVNEFELEVNCSSGTYIRSLCRDIAEALNTYGIMTHIQRTRCGGFYLKDAETLQDLEAGTINIIPLKDVFDYIEINLESDDKEKLLNGTHIPYQIDNGLYKLFYNKEFLGVGKVSDNMLNLYLRLV